MGLGSTDAEEPATDGDSSIQDVVIWNLSETIKVRLSQIRYLTFTCIGVSLLWPWNCFLSASGYYSDRFSDSPSLGKVYSSSMMTIFTITSTASNYYLALRQKNVHYGRRINMGLSLMIGVFILMAFSCTVNFLLRMNDHVFFVLLMIMVFITSAATSLAQNGTMAMVNVLGSIYANGVMVGQAVAGILPSIALIISVLLLGNNERSYKQESKNLKGENEKDYGIFVYYIMTSLIALMSMLLFRWVGSYKRTESYSPLPEEPREEESNDEMRAQETTDDLEQNTADICQTAYVPFSVLWLKLKPVVMTIFFIFCVTLAFPVFASKVESVRPNPLSKFFKKDIYIPFIFFMWNAGDLLGRVLCGMKNSRFLITSGKKLVIFSLLRIFFIPLFLTCNLYPGYKRPIINSDTWHIILQFLFGWTNGQLATSCFMTVSNYCDNDNEKEAAGGFTTIFLSVGLACGSIFSYVLVLVLY